jgi:hypothetical protein
MTLGHAAGIAASIAIKEARTRCDGRASGCASAVNIHDVPRHMLEATLRADGQVIDLPSEPRPPVSATPRERHAKRR